MCNRSSIHNSAGLWIEADSGQAAYTVVGKAAGYHEVRFDASGLSSGVYFYRLQAGDFVQTRKLLLVR